MSTVKGPLTRGSPSLRSPGTHTVGPWVTDNIELYRDLRTGTQYTGNWASRDRFEGFRKGCFHASEWELCHSNPLR